MREKTLESRLSKFVESYGGFCLKLTPTSDKGLPDRVVLLEGRVVFVEVKTIKGILSREQKYWGKVLQDLGLNYCVVKSESDFKEVINGR